MKISEIRDLLEADVLCCGELADKESLFRMRLGYDERRTRLCEGSGRAADGTGQFAGDPNGGDDGYGSVSSFVRSKAPTEEMLALARESGIVILATGMRMYEACGKLYANGLRGQRRQSLMAADALRLPF